MKGFWGDIVCSPFFALGVDCDTPNKHAEGLYEIINKVRYSYIIVLCLVYSFRCTSYSGLRMRL